MPSLLELVVAAALVLGTFLMLVTCVGLLRFPDVFCRMHAAGKAGTLGVSFLILAAIVYFLVVTPYTKAKERFFPDAPEAPAPEVELLTQIRDSLAAR